MATNNDSEERFCDSALAADMPTVLHTMTERNPPIGVFIALTAPFIQNFNVTRKDINNMITTFLPNAHIEFTSLKVDGVVLL